MRRNLLLWFGLVAALLVALGLVVLSSASEANGVRLYHDAYFFMKRQFAYLAAGVVIAVLVARVDYRVWRDHQSLAWLFFGLVCVLLAAVLFTRAINGSHRWIPVGPVRLQPSELAKLAAVVLLSAWLDRCAWHVEDAGRGVLLPSLILSLLVGPILLEPDFGSAMVVSAVGGLLMFVAGARFLWLLGIGVVGGGIGLAMVMLNENRVARLFDESKLYQVKMSLAAIGNSDIWGVGYGQSMQKHLYLPEAHTDFVFAVGAEELGILFSVGVLVLFILFFVLSVCIARKAADRFGRFLVIGMSFIVFFQAMFNLGVICGALPTKGMALPFFSYGGTNMLTSFFAVGTIFSVGIHSYREKRRAMVRKVLV